MNDAMNDAMNEDVFEVFDKYHYRSVKEIFVTIQRRGNFSLNRAAFQAMGSPQFVELLFNRVKRIIGFRPTDSKNGRAVPVRRQSNSDSYMIAGLTFNKEYDIDTSIARRYNATMQGNMLVVDLRSLSTDATGPRLRSNALQRTQDELFSQPDQQIDIPTDSKSDVSKNAEVEQNSPHVVNDVSSTTSEGITDAFANALMQLSDEQKRMILEQLSRGVNQSTKVD